MADSMIVRAASLLVAASLFVATSAAYAQAQQSTPAPTPENSSPAAAAQRQQTQPLNNAPVWRDVRSGAPQTTTVVGRETNVLIQPQGETWRALRVPIVFWGGVIVALAILGLAVFYLWRGPLDLPADEKRGGRQIERFTPMDRYAHWLLAIVWVTLAITGLILSLGKSVLLPLIGYTLFSWLAILAKNLHNFVGPILIVAVPLMFIRYIRDNGIGMDDVKWFINIVGYFKGHEYPSGRFNAGEKLVFWFVLVLFSTILIITGLVHVYLGTIGMVDAYKAMRYGYVDESWAKHHHLRWYQDIVAGRSRQHFADQKPAPPPARPAPRTRPA
jgi:formate dehydrogenase subunit gamma